MSRSETTMQPSWRLLLGIYLFLSAGLYLPVIALTGWRFLAVWPYAAGVVCALQAVFALVAGSLRYAGRMGGFRLLLCSLFVAWWLVIEFWLGWAILSYRLLELGAPRFGSDEAFFSTFIAIWIGVAGLLWWRCRRMDRLAAAGWVVGALAGATAVELAIGGGGYVFATITDRMANPTYSQTRTAMLLNLLVLAWAAGPAMVWLYYRGMRRQMRGVCVACGYDLHGLSEQRCPECGRAFTFAEVRATAEELRMAGSATATTAKATAV